MSAAICAAVTCTAGAATSSEIQTKIDSALQQQDEAHQIAEYVRAFGESDSHPAIQFAKQKWQEQQSVLSTLYEQYDKAVAAESKGTYLGTFRISFYCPCSICNGSYSGTATGAPLTPWRTIAVDSSVIRLNSTVYIEGLGTFQAQDTGGAIKGSRIDVCVGNHAEAMRLGIQYKAVYVK